MRLAKWQEKLILEDLDFAFENRLTVGASEALQTTVLTLLSLDGRLRLKWLR